MKTAISGCIGVIAILTIEFSIIGMLPALAAHYHLTPGEGAWLISGFALMVALAGPVMTLLTVNMQRKQVMLFALSLFALGAVISFFQPPFWLLFVARILPAAFHPIYYSYALAIAMKSAPPEKKSGRMAVVLAGISIATVTTVPLSTYISGKAGWPYAYLFQAFVALTAIMVNYSILPAHRERIALTLRQQLRTLKQADVIMNYLLIILMVGAWFVPYSFFAEYLGKVMAFGPVAISSLMLLFGITGLAGIWAAGKTLDKNILLTTLACLGGTLLVWILMKFVRTDQLNASVIIAIWGFLYGPTYLIVSARTAGAAPDTFEFANSVAASVTNLGIAIGALMGGWVVSRYGVEHIFTYSMAIGILALAVTLLTWLLFSKKDQYLINQ